MLDTRICQGAQIRSEPVIECEREIYSCAPIATSFYVELTSYRVQRSMYARAVIDASGTYTTPNPLGAGGLPAVGERALADQIVYGIPDALGRDRLRYAGRRVLVAGSGHSAFNAILDLAALAEQEKDTSITWIVRRGEMGGAYGGGANDALPARGALGERIRTLVERGVVQLIRSWRTERAGAHARRHCRLRWRASARAGG